MSRMCLNNLAAGLLAAALFLVAIRLVAIGYKVKA